MNDGQYLADAKPGWRRVAIGAAGPVPEAALTMAPSDRLCLTTWRSMFVEGAPATFINCPKQRSRNSRAAAKAAKTAVEARKAARAAEAEAQKAGASARRAQAAGKRAAQLVISRDEVKVSTRLHEGGFGASSHSSWDIIPEINPEIASPEVEAAGGGAPRAVRIVPRSAPHMCLGAPALLHAAEAGSAAGAVAEVQRAVAVQRAKRATKAVRVNAERARKRDAKGGKGGVKGGAKSGIKGGSKGGGRSGGKGKHARGRRGKGSKWRPSGDVSTGQR